MFERDIFGEEHHQFRETVRRFFRKEVEPYVGQWESEGMFPREIFRKAGAAGLLQVGLPAEYGGGGGDFLHQVIFQEEHGYSTAGASVEGFLATDLSSYVIWRAGTDEQKRYWIPRYASGEVVAEVGITEPQSGSDVANVRTTAISHGDHYVLNGTKIWLTNLSHCDMLIVVARTDPATKSAGGLSVLLVDADSPGITRSRPIETAARGSGNVGQVFFENVRVPADRLLGGVEGRGLGQIMMVVNDARLTNAARWLASCETAYGLTLDFVRNRQAFGQRVLDFQNTQFRLADMKTEIAVGRAFLDKYLLKGLAGTITFDETAMVKLWISELEGRVMDQCVQLHGGMGFANESAISKMWTSARVHRIYLGTSEMQRLAIAKGIRAD